MVLPRSLPRLHTFRSLWTTCFPGLRNQHALGFVSREGLVNGMIVHSEMPSAKIQCDCDGLEARCSWRARDLMRQRYGRIVGRMNSDKCRRIGRCKGRPHFSGGIMLWVIFNPAAPAGARPLMAARRQAQHKKKREAPPGQRQETQMCEISPYHPAVARGKRLKAARRESCRIIRHLGSGIRSTMRLSLSQLDGVTDP